MKFGTIIARTTLAIAAGLVLATGTAAAAAADTPWTSPPISTGQAQLERQTEAATLATRTVATTASHTSDASAASASPSSSAQESVLGVGIRSWVNQPRSLYQCPHNVSLCLTNRGQAYPGNDLANVCYHYDSSTQWTWNLVYNRANGHTGLITTHALAPESPKSTRPCATVGVGGRIVDDYTPMYQCPGFNCNQGSAYRFDDIAVICHVTAHNVTWIWGFNHYNKHVGFIPLAKIHWTGTIDRC